MFQTKVAQEVKTYILSSIIFSPQNRAFCEIMWKNMVQGDRQAAGINVVRRMRVACWIPKTTNTRLCDTCCFSTTTVVMRTRLNVTRTVLVLFECRPGPKSATKKDHFTGTYVSSTSVLSKVCLLNSVSVSKPQLHVLIALYSYS